jgi:hypothetical protein
MPAEQVAPQTESPESLSEVVSFRITGTEKAAIRLIAAADSGGLTESEVLRRFLDAAGLRAEADRLREKLVA